MKVDAGSRIPQVSDPFARRDPAGARVAARRVGMAWSLTCLVMGCGAPSGRGASDASGGGQVGPGPGSTGAAGRSGSGESATAVGGAPMDPPAGGNAIFVTPTGSSSNDGRGFATAVDFASALSRVGAGDTIRLQAGTYVVPYRAGEKNSIVFSRSGQPDKPILVTVDGEGGRALFDFSFPEQAWVQDSVGFSVTGSYWIFRGIDITRAGYQGAYVTGQHNVFDNCAFFDNRNTGLEINKGGAYTTVINCDSYRNYDPKKLGSMADGFGPKETQGPGNAFIGCRAWENADDAYDSAETVHFERCWAFRSGIDNWGIGAAFAGNGNGFKVGGNFKQANHKLVGCVSFENRAKGFDQNNNSGGITIYNSTAYDNGTNFGLVNAVNVGQQHDIKNCVSLGAPVSIANAALATNSWSAGAAVSAADFVSLDLAVATAARLPGGELPKNDLFRLKEGSGLIDAGTGVGLPFTGRAPDLGAFESAY